MMAARLVRTRLIVSDGHPQGLFLPDYDKKFPGPRDARVDQVSFEQHVVLHGYRDHHGWELGALRLVDGDRVGQRGLVQLAEIVGHQSIVVANEELMLNGIDLLNGSDVAVEDLLLVVVFSLNNLVANLEPPSKPFRDVLRLALRVQGLLECRIQLAANGSHMEGWPTRTKPQAPRMLHRAIKRLHGPGKSAIVALYCQSANPLLMRSLRLRIHSSPHRG
jgi:hypothetical protein